MDVYRKIPDRGRRGWRVVSHLLRVSCLAWQHLMPWCHSPLMHHELLCRSRTAVAPLERLKILMQVQGSSKLYTGVWQVLAVMLPGLQFLHGTVYACYL